MTSGAAWLAWLAFGEAKAANTTAAAEAAERRKESRELRQRRRLSPSPTRRSMISEGEGAGGSSSASASATATATATILSSPARSAKARTTKEAAAGKDLPLPPPSLRALAAAALALAAAARAASSSASSSSSSSSSSSCLIAVAFVSLCASLSVSLTHFLLKRAPKSFTLGEASAVACCAALALTDAAAVSLSSSLSSSSASFSASLEALFAGSTRSPESRFVQRVGLGAAAGATLAVPLLRAACLRVTDTGANERNKRNVALALLVAGVALAARPLLRDTTWAVLYALGLEGKLLSEEGGLLSWIGGGGGDNSSSSDDAGDDSRRSSRRQRIVSAWALALLVALPLLHIVAAPPPSSTEEAGAEGEPIAFSPRRSPTKKRKTKRKRWPRPPTILLRKAYHVLALAMFAPVALYDFGGDPGLLCVGLAAAAAALFAAEAARASSLPLLGIGPKVAGFMGRFVDARDEGALLVSHFSLLLGMAGPLWLLSLSSGSDSSKSDSAAAVALSLAGVVSLGTVDAAASAVGRTIGKNKLFGTQKTLEGTLAGAASGAMAWAVLWPRLLPSLEQGWGGGAARPVLRRWLSPAAAAAAPPLSAPPLSAAVLASALSALMEASTTQLDNVFLPLHHLAALGALARLLS